MSDQPSAPTSQNKMKPEKARRVFLRAIEGGRTISEAAEITGYSQQAFFKWKWKDADFAEDWAASTNGKRRNLETAAMTVALSKTPAAVHMLIFLLSATYPEYYCPRVRARRWQAEYARRVADAANSPDTEVVDALFKTLDELEAAKIAQGDAALDPMLA